MPLFGARVFAVRIPGTPTGGPFGKNKLVYHDEFVATEIGQVGTQFDGLGHIGCITGKDGDMTEMRFYNGFTEAEMANAYGLKKLGIEKVKPFFTRGVLVDVAGSQGAHAEHGRGDHRRRRAGGAPAARHRGVQHPAGRRRVLQHRLGQPLDEGQRQVQRGRARHRAGRGAVVRRPSSSRWSARTRGRPRWCRTRIPIWRSSSTRADHEERDLSTTRTWTSTS